MLGSGHLGRARPERAIDGATAGGMVALFRDVQTNEPCGIQGTFLDLVADLSLMAVAARFAKCCAPQRDAPISLTVFAITFMALPRRWRN
jgi:hypothetical protein